jgi:hypothetical protein
MIFLPSYQDFLQPLLQLSLVPFLVELSQVQRSLIPDCSHLISFLILEIILVEQVLVAVDFVNPFELMPHQ